MSAHRQNHRSKANPGPDGKPRSTEPKGFKQRRSGITRAQFVRALVDEVEAGGPVRVFLPADPQAEPLEPRKPYTAAGFKRATDLTAPAEPEPQVVEQPEGPLAPLDWRIQAMVLADGACAVTGEVASHWLDKGWQVHHVIPKSVLRGWNLHAWVWDLRNALPLRVDVHGWFDDATDRCIPREVLPQSIWIFANDLDEHMRTSAATEYVLSRYPLVGAERLADLRSPTPQEPE